MAVSFSCRLKAERSFLLIITITYLILPLFTSLWYSLIQLKVLSKYLQKNSKPAVTYFNGFSIVTHALKCGRKITKREKIRNGQPHTLPRWYRLHPICHPQFRVSDRHGRINNKIYTGLSSSVY